MSEDQMSEDHKAFVEHMTRLEQMEFRSLSPLERDRLGISKCPDCGLLRRAYPFDHHCRAKPEEPAAPPRPAFRCDHAILGVDCPGEESGSDPNCRYQGVSYALSSRGWDPEDDRRY